MVSNKGTAPDGAVHSSEGVAPMSGGYEHDEQEPAMSTGFSRSVAALTGLVGVLLLFPLFLLGALCSVFAALNVPWERQIIRRAQRAAARKIHKH